MIMLRLRPYKACDGDTIVSWIKDETAFYQWSADRYDHYPITGEDMNAQYHSFAYADNFYEMTAFDETGIVGHLILRFTDEEKKILRFGFVIVNDTKRGMGYGKEMLQLAIRYAFDIIKAEAITLGVFENNAPAYQCYKAVGFQEIGKTETYRIQNEEWICRELMLRRTDTGADPSRS